MTPRLGVCFDALRLRQANAVFFEPLDTEQLGANRGVGLFGAGKKDFSGVKAERWQPV
jgi:hypothetical protein